MKPNVDLYASPKNVISVERVLRRLDEAGGSSSFSGGAEPGAKSWACMDFVIMAVCVTLIGIMVFLIGASRTI